MITDEQKDMITEYGNASGELATCIDWGTGSGKAVREKIAARTALEAEFSRLNGEVERLNKFNSALLLFIEEHGDRTLLAHAKSLAKLREEFSK